MSTARQATPVTVYWRPGCLWCALLRRGLKRAGIATTEVDIWDDPDAAATVRRVAGGNETVPTVFVGDVPLVNPTVAEVRDALAGAAGAAGAPGAPRHDTAHRGSWIRRVLRRAPAAGGPGAGGRHGGR